MIDRFRFAHAALWVALVCCIGFGSDSDASSEEKGTGRSDADTEIVVRITNRNGSVALAAVLVELLDLSQNPHFAPVLKMSPSQIAANRSCAETARRDPSGRLFDLARCAKIWPPREKAPEPKLFEQRFASLVTRQGVAAFPAVLVSTFEFQNRLQAAEIPGTNKYIEHPDGTLEPTPQVKALLCNPAVTFIERCQIRVVARFANLQPDFFLLQTGYQVVVTNSVPERLAVEIKERVDARLDKVFPTYKNLRLASNMPQPPFTVLVAPRKRGTAASQAVDPTQSSRQLPGVHLDELWRSIGKDSKSMEIDAGPTLHPNVLIFDNVPEAKVSEFRDWYRTLTEALSKGATTSCTLSAQKSDWHSDAVASLFFPASIQTLLQTPTAALLDVPWAGYILTPPHLEGFLPVQDGNMWYESIVGPAIGVVVFDDLYDEQDPSRKQSADDAAKRLIRLVLSNQFNLLVVTAPQSRSTTDSGGYDGDPGPPSSLSMESVATNCLGRQWGSWPSCLGKHPRVLVVAPATGIENQWSELFQPKLKYKLGGSTVRIAAPGFQVPVVSPCQSGTGEGANARWGVTYQDGSSFAAPIVGLILARMIDQGPSALQRTPAGAIWRLLATADPLSNASRNDIAFGRVNAGRALQGADAATVGIHGKATIVERGVDGKPGSVRYAVVLPYPWNDTNLNINQVAGVSQKPGLASYSRGVLAYSELGDKGVFLDRTPLEFRRLLRIARHAASAGAGADTFDLYYLTDVGGDLHEVAVKSNVRLGVSNPTQIYMPGFCALAGSSPPMNLSPSGQAQPACLYEWNPDSSDPRSQFTYIDMTKVEDIILPPLHFEYKFVKNIVPTDVKMVVGSDSPWRKEFCETRPRVKVVPLLKMTGFSSLDAACAAK